MIKLLKFRGASAATLLLCLCAAMTPSARAQQQQMTTVPAGTRLLVRLVDTIDAGRSRADNAWPGCLGILLKRSLK